MGKEIEVTANDKAGNEVAKFMLTIPETFEEMTTIPGEAQALAYVVDKMKITARAKYKRGEPSVFPKSLQAQIREALKGSEISQEELIELIKSRKK